MPDPLGAANAAATRPIRLGIHGSPDLPREILARAGREPGDTEFVPYDVRDPFGPLRAGRVDLMIVKYTVQEPDIAFSEPVALDTRAVIVGPGHPLAGRETVSVEEVADYDGFECPGGFPADVWDQVVPPVTRGGRAIRRVHPMTTLEAMTDILSDARSLHLSFLSLAPALPPGAVAVPVHDLPPAPVSFAWLRAEPPSPEVARLIADAERSAR